MIAASRDAVKPGLWYASTDVAGDPGSPDAAPPGAVNPPDGHREAPRRPSGRFAALIGLTVLFAASVPLAHLLVARLGDWFMPPEFIELRTQLRPIVTPWMRSLPVLALVATGLGALWQSCRALGKLASLPDRDLDQVIRTHVEALFLAASLPQIPALFALIRHFLGSESRPAVLTLVLSSVGVLLLGALAVRSVAR